MLNELLPELADVRAPGKLRAKRVPSLTTIIRLGDQRTPGMFNFGDVLASRPSADDPSVSQLSDGLSNTDAINIQFTSGTTGSPKGRNDAHAQKHPEQRAIHRRDAKGNG